MMTPATTIETPENEWKRDRTRTPTYLYKAALELETHDGEHVGDGKVPWDLIDLLIYSVLRGGKIVWRTRALYCKEGGRKQSRPMTQTVSRHCLAFLFHCQ